MVIIISTLVLLLGILIWILGEDNETKSLGVLIPLISIIFGFGLLGCLLPVNESKTDIDNFQLIKTEYRTIVDTRYGAKIINNSIYYNLEKEDLKVYFIEGINSYGIKLNSRTNIKVEIKEGESIE